MTYGILLAGGSGERFWPKSRKIYPKQFLTIGGKESLIERTIRRISKRIPRKNLRIVTLKEQGRAFRKLCPSLKEGQLFLEPFGRNTAASVALAAFEIRREDPDAVLIVLPCDQWIRDERKFLESLREVEKVAKGFEGIVTLGVPPTYPATGFGYLCHATRAERYGKGKAYPIERFVEKPNLKRAKRLLRQGSVLWSIGLFAFRIPVLLRELQTHMPHLYKGFLRIEALKDRQKRAKALRGVYQSLRPISFDYGILEHVRNLSVVAGRFGWRDLGSWRSLEALYPSKNGNLLLGDAYAEDGKGNIFISEKGHLLAGIGVSDMIAVHTGDATLICPKGRAEEVKILLTSLARQKNFSQPYL
ncbi:MAG: mannose-1-phosphate guanylyltransferase [Candidatus Omnitrophica bacterium]|nr:mannose-1-phosphate guanylyltransferase [Candidatus Omnitrophota bacterium]